MYPFPVYDSLVEAIHKGLPHHAAVSGASEKVLGLDTLHMYDLYCPMVEDVEYKIDYEGSKAMVKKALEPLGADYQKLLDKAYSERWMDVYENKGKTTGAFSCGVHGVHPYVLLNFTNSLEDVFTMAHELGHAMHSYLSSQHNSFANHDYRAAGGRGGLHGERGAADQVPAENGDRQEAAGLSPQPPAGELPDHGVPADAVRGV